MMMATTLRHLDQLLHTVERGRALNVDELGRLPVRLYGPDGQPLFTEQNPAHVKGEVTLTGSLGTNVVRAADSLLTVAPNTEIIVSDTSEPCVLDRFVWLTSGRTVVRVRIYAKTADGELELINRNVDYGTTSDALRQSPASIVEQGDDLWKVLAYDTDAARYKFALDKPLYFPYGMQIIIGNEASGAEHSVSYLAQWRTF